MGCTMTSEILLRETWNRYYTLMHEAKAAGCRINYVKRRPSSVKRTACIGILTVRENITQLEWALQDPKSRVCRIYE